MRAGGGVSQNTNYFRFLAHWPCHGVSHKTQNISFFFLLNTFSAGEHKVRSPIRRQHILACLSNCNFKSNQSLFKFEKNSSAYIQLFVVADTFEQKSARSQSCCGPKVWGRLWRGLGADSAPKPPKTTGLCCSCCTAPKPKVFIP